VEFDDYCGVVRSVARFGHSPQNQKEPQAEPPQTKQSKAQIIVDLKYFIYICTTQTEKHRETKEKILI
jgi:hypothetical protein